MSRIFIDGFESGGHDLWEEGANPTVISSAGFDMDGNYCLDLNDSEEFVQKTITADDEMYFAFLYRPISGSYSEAIISVYNGATCLLSLRRSGNDAGLPVACRGGNTTLAVGTIGLTVSSTYFIEVRVKVADAGGRFVVKIDGGTSIDFTGDTKIDSNTQFDKVRLGYGPDAAYSTRAFFDNFIADDAGWIGKTLIQAVKPSGVGTTNGWTPSAGNNWDCVDEVPASDADYVSINIADITDTYAAANMTGSIDNVKCIQIQSRARKEGAAGVTNLKLVVRSGGADYLSANKALVAGAKSVFNIWELNPADSLAWEEADVNAMEIGVKSAA